jgi:hypothetical protein
MDRQGRQGKQGCVAYNPMLGTVGRPLKVVVIATDVTAQQMKLEDVRSWFSWKQPC